MVKGLNSGLTAGAELTLIRRMFGITLELLRSTLHRSNKDAAPGGALTTSGRVPIRYARYDFIVRNQVRNEFMNLRLAAWQRSRSNGRRCSLDPCTPLNLHSAMNNQIGEGGFLYIGSATTVAG